MIHILDTSHEELERTHRLAERYKERHLKSKVFWFLPWSFKKIFRAYAGKKEELLLAYKSLHTDIQTKKIDPLSDTLIQTQLDEITKYVEWCSKLLSKLVAHSNTQEWILLHEKVFFVGLLKSFQDDMLLWVWTHETAIFWENQETLNSQEENPIKKWIEILKLKKQQLKEYIDTNSNT